ncbi:MAG: hypothetical protein KBD01_04660 [Acidobacteria bacterium]|nr:hypothetical protein [Acidobacteriota bacterium]
MTAKTMAAACALLAALAGGAAARAETAEPGVDQLRAEVQELRVMVRQLFDRVEQQDAMIRELRGGPPAPAPAPAAEPVAPAPARTPNAFNPAIALVGNFLAVAGRNPVEDLPNAQQRESELSLQAVVDPYARADVYLAFGEEDVELEEGYVTFTALPWDLLLKVGRMRASFGKVNTLHLHALPWADEPLTLENLLGGGEGWAGSGASIARLLPFGDTFSELTLEAFHGEAGEGELFSTARRRDLAYNAHYRVFRDLSESTNSDLGLSYARGPNDSAPGAWTSLGGADVTVRWKPLRTARSRSLTLRGEYVRSRREQPGADERADGWFVAGDYQLARRWALGARVEAAEHGDDAALEDRGGALILTFWPSEFSQLRGEYRRRRYFDEITADELLMQLQFSIGAHGAHPF